MAAAIRDCSLTRTPRDRSASLNASAKLTITFNSPVTAIPATHHQNTGCASSCQPRAPTAAASWPLASVTWRTSSGSAKNAATAGTSPSSRPSEMLPARPEMLLRHQPAQRCARKEPSRDTMRGLCAIALSSRWKTNQFSAQPAISELANSSTPVKAANRAVGPSSVMLFSTYSASSVPTGKTPRLNAASHCTPSTSGTHINTLPTMPAVCERISAATRSTKTSMSSALPGPPAGKVAASAGAVIAGCLVATVQCSSMTMTKLIA